MLDTRILEEVTRELIDAFPTAEVQWDFSDPAQYSLRITLFDVRVRALIVPECLQAGSFELKQLKSRLPEIVIEELSRQGVHITGARSQLPPRLH